MAKATGQDDRIDADDAARLRKAAAQWGDTARSPGVFGPELPAPPDADEQTKLLAFVGRQR